MKLGPPPCRRRGLSLLEVLVAMSIFLFSVIALYHLVGQATDRALDVQQQSQAIQLCQAKLAEVNAGAVPLGSQADVPFDEDPDWHWSLDAQQGSVPGLWQVTVKVSRQRPNGFRLESSLSQLVLDPSLRGNNTQPVVTPDTPSSSSDNSQSPGGTNGSQQGTNTPNLPGNVPTNQGSKTPAAPAAGSPTPKPSTPTPTPPASTPRPAASPSPAPSAPAVSPRPAGAPSPAPKPPTRGGN